MWVFLLYFLLMIIGLIWSQDIVWGMHVLGRQWFWLLIPIVIAVLSDHKWRERFLASLSAGLLLNLLFCVMQMFGVVEVTTVGSNANDATGHIGHIGFGVVYGLWGAWLLHLGFLWQGKQRLFIWCMGAWAYLMVFMAQGRAGLVVATVLLMIVAVFHFRKLNVMRLIAGTSLFVLLVVLGLVLGPHKDRWQSFWHGIATSTPAGVLSDTSGMGDSTDQRLYMLLVSLEVWKQSPVLGVGTGGLPEAVKKWSQEEGHVQRFLFVHPHNQYLLDLARWGPTGLFLLLLLYVVWFRESCRWDWDKSKTAPLIALTSVALASHGLFAPSMEEHFSALLAALMLGVGLSDRSARL